MAAAGGSVEMASAAWRENSSGESVNGGNG